MNEAQGILAGIGLGIFFVALIVFAEADGSSRRQHRLRFRLAWVVSFLFILPGLIHLWTIALFG